VEKAVYVEVGVEEAGGSHPAETQAVPA